MKRQIAALSVCMALLPGCSILGSRASDHPVHVPPTFVETIEKHWNEYLKEVNDMQRQNDEPKPKPQLEGSDSTSTTQPGENWSKMSHWEERSVTRTWNDKEKKWYDPVVTQDSGTTYDHS